MREFFKFFLASLLALLVFSVILFFFFAGLFSSLASHFAEEKVSLKPNSVLRLNTNYEISEQTRQGLPTGLSWLSFSPDRTSGLNDILADIHHAATDDHIKGIYIELGLNPNSYGTLQEIRNALEDFKKQSGKFVIAYGEMISQNSYYLGSVADKVYLNPSGEIDFKGLAAQVTFFKGALDKLGVHTEIFYDGKFKSATEPFRMDHMSDANKLQLREFLNSLFNENLSEINRDRPKSVEAYRNIADSLLAWYPEEAVRIGLLDGLKYQDEVGDEIKSRCGLDTSDSIPFVNTRDYRKTFRVNDGNKQGNAKIAVVYVDGDISDGTGDNGYVGSKTFTEWMRDVRTDANIKAVVLRVNSPGGSAVASDVMWREVEITKKIKPVYVSMGDYAASGGYMLSCGADKIYAEPNTLTGSIGVFLIVPEISDLMNDKLGITFDTSKTSQFADFPSITHPFSEREKAILQMSVDSTYRKFKEMVAQGRNMSVNAVEQIAQGRIWIGTTAKELGLVDSIGSIADAIKGAAYAAKLSSYSIVEYPQQQPSLLENIITGLASETDAKLSIDQLHTLYPAYMNLQQLLEHPAMEARLPYDMIIH